MQNLQRMGKNSGPILSRFWTKVQEILGRRSGPLALSKPLPECLCAYARFIQKIFATKSRSRRKTEQMQKFWPHFPF